MPAIPSPVHGLVRGTIETGANRDRKTLLEALVHEIRVEGRDRIRPTFRVPTDGSERMVRTLPESVLPTAYAPHGKR